MISQLEFLFLIYCL